MNILARLTAQATGAKTSRLRPKLPGRFESTGQTGEGFSVISEEIPAERPAFRPEAPEAGPEAPHPSTGTGSAPPRQSLRAVLPDKSVEPETTLPLPFPRQPVGERRTEQPVSMRHRIEQDATPEPFQEVRSGTKARAVAQVRPSDRALPPQPLLPQAASAQFARAAPLIRGSAPHVQGEAAPPFIATPNPAAPEITIHIGRIDLREAAPTQTAAKSKASKRDRPVSKLGDYLKGGRS